MKYLFTLLLVFFASLSFGQNYHLLVNNPKEAVYFEDREQRITALAAKGKITLNGETTWELNDWGSLFVDPWHMASDTVHPSFLGTSFTIGNNGKTVLHNSYAKEEFTICHGCKKGESWTVGEDPKLTATISDIVEETVNGGPDSVKIISLSNKTEMRISRKNGVLTTPAFFSNYNGAILKRRAPAVLTTRDVYDMEIGDVFHWAIRSGWNSRQKHILTLLSKAVDTLADSVTYSVDRIRETPWYGVTRDTVKWKYPYFDAPLFGVLPGGLRDHPFDQVPEHWKTSYFLAYKSSGYRFNDTSWNRLYADFEYVSGMQTTYEYYAKGCGDFYYSEPESEPGSVYSRRLVYFKKGTEIWGKGLTINVPCICPAKLSTPLIYPNLANQIIFISDESEYGPATLQSLNGQVEIIDLSNGKYNINHLAAGAYFITFKSGRREKFMVVR